MTDEEEPPQSAARPWTARRILGPAAIPIAIVLGLPFCGRLAGSCMGYEDLVMAQLNACPEATALLGAPIVESSLGLSCGNAEVGGGDGEASWRMPVTGPRGRGSYDFSAVEHGGQWTVTHGTLEGAGREIDVTQCALAGRGQGLLATRRLRGTVVSSTGSPPVSRDATCDVTLGPGGGSFGCRIVVTCGARTLYGATPTTGFARCTVQPGPDGREAITALDSSSHPDGDPELDLHTATGEVLITDRRPAVPWSITLRLEGGS